MKNKLKKFFSLDNKEFKIHQNMNYLFLVPLIIILIAAIAGTIYAVDKRYYGFIDVGIDFKGGTVLNVEMNGEDMLGKNRSRNLEIITKIVENNGAKVVLDQNSGSNTLIVRYANVILIDGVRHDYNRSDKTEEMDSINTKIGHEIEKALKNEYNNQNLAVKASAETINASASADLIKNSLLAAGIAMAIMLIYMAFRFDLFSGLSALTMQFVDIIIMMCFVIIFRIQLNSSIIAGLITIIAYSINNTIVVFDRIRDNVKLVKSMGSRLDIQDIVNSSVKQSFKRTLLTSITTLTTITILALVGVKPLTNFALPIIFGLLSGLYSSLFLAPNLWGLLMNAKMKNTKNTKKLKKRRKRA